MENLDYKDIENMVHAYELGLLSQEQRRKLELYLLDNEEKLKEIKEFKSIIGLLRDDTDIRELIRNLADETVTAEAERPGKRLRTWLTPALAALIIIVILLIQPWKVEIHPSHDAIAAENRMAIVYFTNMANREDPNNYGDIIANLLITDLSESRYLQVLSRERVTDIIKIIGVAITDTLSSNSALAIARQGEARWLLTGAIVREEPGFILTTQLVNTTTGDVVSSQRVDGEPGQPIFELVDQLTVKIKAALSLPEQAFAEEDPPVSFVTTTSLTAYQYYLEGVDNFHKLYMLEATEAFKKSLEYDSTLAMSHYYLAVLEDTSYIRKAVRHSSKAPRIIRNYIAALEALLAKDYDSAITTWKGIAKDFPDQKHAYYLVGLYQYFRHHMDEAREYLEKAIAIDPNFKLPYNDLAYVYGFYGELEKALKTIDRYIELAPDEANPYDSKADFLLKIRDINEAQKALRQALAIKPDYYQSAFKLAYLFLFQDKADSARSIYRQYALESSNRAVRYRARLYLACLPLYQGKLAESLELLDDLIAADRLENGRETEPAFRIAKSLIYSFLSNLDLALDEMERAMEYYEWTIWDIHATARSVYVQFLAQSGDIDKAKEIAAEILAENEHNRQHPRYLYAAAAIAASETRYDEAIENFSEARRYNEFAIIGGYSLGQVFWESGRYQEVIDIYDSLISIYDYGLIYWNTLIVKSHYYLARAYEMTGRTSDAVTHYQLFLNLWEQADSPLAEIPEARKRLKALKALPH